MYTLEFSQLSSTLRKSPPLYLYIDMYPAGYILIYKPLNAERQTQRVSSATVVPAVCKQKQRSTEGGGRAELRWALSYLLYFFFFSRTFHIYMSMRNAAVAIANAH